MSPLHFEVAPSRNLQGQFVFLGTGTSVGVPVVGVIAMFVLVMTRETSEQEQVWFSDYQTVRFLSTRLRIFARSF